MRGGAVFGSGDVWQNATGLRVRGIGKGRDRSLAKAAGLGAVAGVRATVTASKQAGAA